MKMIFILAAIIVFHFAGSRSENTVIDLAVSETNALVVSSQAVNAITLDKNKMELYAKNIWESTGKVLDTSMFAEIIINARSLDTKSWKDEELNNLLVVHHRDQEISKEYMTKKLNLSGKKQLRYYSRLINRYNETSSSERDIYFVSRPVYNATKKYAIVQWRNDKSGLSGSGGINLYHLDGSKWINIGLILKG